MDLLGVTVFALGPLLAVACAVDAYRKGFKRRAGLLLFAAVLGVLSVIARFTDSSAVDGLLAFMTGVCFVAALQYAVARVRGTAA